MATPTGYGSNIRQSLVSKGLSNNDIGYNKSSGYVTVKGQDFLKPSKNLDGVSYDTVSNFNNAWNNYQKSQSPGVTTTTGTTSTSSGYTPTASTYSPKGLVSSRDALGSYGISGDRVGYSNGNVTVDGRYFGTPGANLSGTTYFDQTGFNNAMSNYQIGNMQNQIMNNTQLPDNAYTQQINDLLAQLNQQASNPQQVDPYSTAQYAAYKAQSDRAAQQGIRSAQEAMGASGFGRSTMLGERAQGIQNSQNEYLETQVVPQIIAAEQARQQQEYANLFNLLSPLMSQQGYADDRSQMQLGNQYNALNMLTQEQQRGIDNSRADASLTGNYLSPEQQSAINTLQALKQSAEAPGITAQQRNALSTQADAVRNQMRSLGLDPTQYGSDVSYNQASQYQPGRTLAGQQLDMQQQQQAYDQEQQQWSNDRYIEEFEYQKARDAIEDKRLAKEFEENVRQHDLNYALQKLESQNQQEYRNATLALDKQQFEWQQDTAIADAEVATARAAAEAASNTTSIQDFAKTYVNSIAKRDSKTGAVLNKKEVFSAFIASGYDDEEIEKMLPQYGITTKEADQFQNEVGAGK